MRLREHPGIGEGRTDILPCDPRQLSVVENYNVRDLTTPEAREELDELKAQVREHGVKTPLVVRFDGESIFIVEGHRRHKVALELIAEYDSSGGVEGRNIDFVPIKAEASGTTELDRDFGLETSNSGRPLKPLELGNLIYRLMNQRGLSIETVAKGLGKSVAVCRNRLKERGDLSEEVKKQVGEGSASTAAAHKLMKNLPKGTDPDLAAQIIKEAADEQKRLGKKPRATPKAINRALERRKPTPPASEPPKPEISDDEKRARAAALGDAKQREPAQIAVEGPAEAQQPLAEQPGFSPLSDEAPPVHPQLQSAAERERVVTLAPPAPPPTITYPNLQSLVSSEIQKVLGELASIAEDNALGDRDPSETIPVSVSLIARADRLYRQIIGDTVTEAA